ncbi:MAG: lytic transglycosylase, partial [Bacteroidetes bacterium SW_10_40_5]
MKRAQILAIIVVIIGPLISFSNNDPKKNSEDSVGVAEVQAKAIVTQMDSLLNLWYVQKNSYDTSRSNLNLYGFDSGEVPSYSDSVYNEKINALETPVPLTYNKYVKSFINLYSQRRRDLVERMLGLSNYYFPIFEKELDRKNLPLELKYLPVIESA